MAIRFLHAADVHLGYRQYGSAERYDDFFRVFGQLVDDALSQETAFLLLAGDLFHKRDADPETLYRAVQELVRLRNAGVPVLAIEGNHEKPRQTLELSWLDFLNNMGLITLLGGESLQGQMQIYPWDEARSRGVYLDLPIGDDGQVVRVMGLQYSGKSTSAWLKGLVAHLEGLSGPRPAYSVLMLHAGLQGVLPHYSASLTRDDLEILRPHVDYVALGHIHKPYSQDEWLYNPGSLEANNTQEALYPDRGYCEVWLQPEGAPPHRVTKRRTAGRRFLLLSLPVDRYLTPEALGEGLARYLEAQRAEEAAPEAPVVDLRLTGILAFDRADLDIEALKAHVERIYAPVLCNVRDQTSPRDLEVGAGESLSRAELERQVLVDLVARDASRQPQADRYAELALSLKAFANARSGTELIIAELQSFLEAE